ncbi:MAG: DNA recombination-dependent growth factor C, partial [Syntrophales bacterium LBB04]|nr:DNA recombination-dependent growth factor C [Syntrophales bacterium LBB04]
MGLLKGTFSFSRYCIAGDLPAKFNDFIDERLKKYSFMNIIVQASEKSIGWTSLENVLDNEFTYAKYK